MTTDSAPRRLALALASVLAVAATACSSDQVIAPESPQAQPSAPSASLFSAWNAFQRYVAIGTSISAGVQSDGLDFATQATSWPAQLDAAAARILKQPYISGAGCPAPILTPLILATRLSGESALTPTANLSCGPLVAGVTLPVDNVSLNGALTFDALLTTPQNITNQDNAKIYARVLQSGATQISTMLARNPTVVSVELGSNEVLGAISGVAIDNVTVVPFGTWAPLYHGVLDQVKTRTNTAVVVGLIDDLGHAPGFRTGDELWADRAEFALFHVNVLNDCQGSPNLIFVPLKVTVAAATGLAAAQHGLGFVPFSCAGSLNPVVPDTVLTPTEVAFVNSRMHDMSMQIQAEAAAHGFAYFALGALYDRGDLKGPFSLTKLMTSLTPFGPYFSADGVHPNAAGQQILARAAAQALNNRYGIGIPLP